MPVEMVYPKNMSKVKKTNVKFQWKPPQGCVEKMGYRFELYRFEEEGEPEEGYDDLMEKNEGWVHVHSATIFDTEFNKNLPGGFLYKCAITPSYHGLNKPSGMLGNYEIHHSNPERNVLTDLKARDSPHRPTKSVFFIDAGFDRLLELVQTRLYKAEEEGKFEETANRLALLIFLISRHVECDQSEWEPIDEWFDTIIGELGEEGEQMCKPAMLEIIGNLPLELRFGMIERLAGDSPAGLYDTAWALKLAKKKD